MENLLQHIMQEIIFLIILRKTRMNPQAFLLNPPKTHKTNNIPRSNPIIHRFKDFS